MGGEGCKLGGSLRSRAASLAAARWPSARARHKARRPLGLAACVAIATPAEASGHFKERFSPREKKSGSGAHGRASLVLIRGAASAPRRCSCPVGGRGRCPWSPPGPGLGGSSPSSAPLRHQPGTAALPEHPVHDPGSREGDAGNYAGDGNGVSAVAKRFFAKGDAGSPAVAEGKAIPMA